MSPQPATTSDLFGSNVVLIAGKGGVGKTTVTAVYARAAARAGRRVLVVELDGKSALAEMLPDIEVMSLSPGTALEEYLVDHGFGRTAKRLLRSGIIDMVAAATPGIDDVVVLGKIKQLERSGNYDTIVVDGPAAGHALTLLTSAAGLLAASSAGPVYRQALEVNEMLTDPARCRVALVTVPETTPVAELIESAFLVEERGGVHLGAVFANQIDVDAHLPAENPPSTTGSRPVPATSTQAESVLADSIQAESMQAESMLAEAADFRRARRAVQDAALARLDHELPIPQVRLPMRWVAGLCAADIDELSRVLDSEIGAAT